MLAKEQHAVNMFWLAMRGILGSPEWRGQEWRGHGGVKSLLGFLASVVLHMKHV